MRLLKDRNLNIAILISASWHLICMFSVSPVLMPGDIRKNSTTISFIGSILEKVIAVPERPLHFDKISFIEKLETRRANGSGDPGLGLPELSSKPAYTKLDKEESTFSVKKDLSRILKTYPKDRAKRRLEFKDLLVTGEARNRIMLYKPDLPKVPLLVSSFNFDYKTTVKFVISRHGFVKDPVCVASSGSSEIDHLAIRYIRRWQFVPHYEEQEGLVRISFSD